MLAKQDCKYRDFCYQKQKTSKYCGIGMFWASEVQKTLVGIGITVFFAPRVSQKRENTTYLTIFGHYETKKKVEGVTTTMTTTTTNNHNHNDNSNSESNRASGRHSGQQQQPLRVRSPAMCIRFC